MAAGGPITALAPAAVVGRVAASGAAGPLAALPPGAQIAATVLGLDVAGRVVLKTEAGTVALAKRVEAARGAVVMLEIREAGAQPVVAVRVIAPAPPQGGRADGEIDTPQPSAEVDARVPAMLLPVPEGAEALPPGHERVAQILAAWVGLDRGVRTLVLGEPQLAREMCLRRLPAPGTDLPRLLAGWLALVRNERTLVDWIGGPAARALARLAPDDARGLDADLAALHSVAGHTLEDGWHVMPIPFLTYEGFRPLALMWRGAERGPEGETPHRFVIQVDPPAFGPMQLDGLLAGRRFALAVRSALALPMAVANDVGALFRTGCRLGGLDGELRFAVGAFPVDPAGLLLASRHATFVA